MSELITPTFDLITIIKYSFYDKTWLFGGIKYTAPIDVHV